MGRTVQMETNMGDRHQPPALEIEALWEVPLGVLSFVFARSLRAVLTNLGRYYNPMNKQEQPDWQVISAPFLAKPLKLLWAMSRARWNVHSLIALAGPFNVTESLSINVHTIAQSTPMWTAVFYTLGDYKTHANISSLSVGGDREWETVPLPPGRYLVGLRHYHWVDPVTLPAIQADGQAALAAQAIAAPPHVNAFYRDLIQRQGWLHICLNGYVYPLLRYRRWLPPRWVRDVFLPVPNPETQFYYGALRRGEQLNVQLAPHLLDTHEVLLSLDNRFCFPLDWYAIAQPEHITKVCDRKTIFIIRVHPKYRDSTFPPEPVRCLTLRPT